MNGRKFIGWWSDVNNFENAIKETLVSILYYSILNIRTAANDEDYKRISYEFEHLTRLTELLMDIGLLNDYMQNSRKKYLEQIRENHENPFEGLWNELQNITENHTAITPILDELDVILMGIISTGIKNISNFMDIKDFENIYIEAYHIHNIPSIIKSKKKDELIKYYFKVERKQYLRDGDKAAKQNFEGIWKELLSIVKPKKKIIFF